MKKLGLMFVLAAAMFCVSCSKLEITEAQLTNAKSTIDDISIYVSGTIASGTQASFSEGYATVSEALTGTAKTITQVKAQIVEAVDDAIELYGSNLDDIFDDIGTSNILVYSAIGSDASTPETANYSSANGSIAIPENSKKNYYKFVITLVADDDYKFADGQDRTVTLYLTVTTAVVQ